MNFSPSPHFENKIEADLDIYNFHFDELEPFEEMTFKRENHASPVKTMRKIRTRSEDISGA